MAINRQVVVMSAVTVANGSTIFSSNYNGEYSTGSRAVFINIAGSSSVTITEQASVDGTTFYDVVSGTGGALGAVCSTLTTTTGVFVVYTPTFALHNRLKVVAGAASTVSLTVFTAESSVT